MLLSGVDERRYGKTHGSEQRYVSDKQIMKSDIAFTSKPFDQFRSPRLAVEAPL